MVLKYFVIYCCNNKLPPNFAYWVGQKIHLDFSITSYGKSWTNFLVNPMFNLLTHAMDQEFVSSLARWLWLPVSREAIVQMLSGFAVTCKSGWAEGATSSSVTWWLSGSLFFSPCRTPWWPSSLSASDLRDRQTDRAKQERERSRWRSQDLSMAWSPKLSTVTSALFHLSEVSYKF